MYDIRSALIHVLFLKVADYYLYWELAGVEMC